MGNLHSITAIFIINSLLSICSESITDYLYSIKDQKVDFISAVLEVGGSNSDPLSMYVRYFPNYLFLRVYFWFAIPNYESLDRAGLYSRRICFYLECKNKNM